MSDHTTMPPVTPARPRFRSAAIIAGLAFLAGLLAMAAVLRYQARWFGLPASVPVVAAKGQVPVVVVPATTTPASPPPVIDLDALSSRETQLAGQLADLEQRTARIASAAQAASGYATRSENMLVAFAARRALDRGLALGYVQDQLRARFAGTQPRAVAAILQAAREPVTVAELRAGLDGIAPELVTGQASTGWLDSFRRELANLIVIHRADTPSPLPVDRLARARQMLEGGKVEAALAEVARMPGAPQAVRWTTAARRYIGARQALDTIEAAAITGQANPTDIPGAVAPPG
ncbi:MICOS complex subunit MIC60 [Sphingomonas hylomeconis]|uniref:MICOS complex subunit MIC60 n=1 Tax=Sphingomonas hylomeconis TaxID=1395958 RepID=A0ABV7SPQ5_9SPHN|nr:MICOS complex subunit MIC60 [Sphingomonas hylomeconis]